MGVQLLGEWEGVPDTAELRAERAALAAETAVVSPPAENTEATDLEAFALRIAIDFSPDGQLEMALNEASKLAGRWRVVSQFGDRAVVELAVNADGEGNESLGGEQRRFDLRMGPDSAWFTLREEGADPMFGQLLFRRGTSKPAPAAPSD
ncbi:MAG: hypothetical protein AAGJ46_05640 [Planctomycetota bacterium]